MKKDYSTLLWGLCIIALGIIFVGNNLNFWDVEVFFKGWYTLFIIIPSLGSILKYGLHFWSVCFLAIGCILLLEEQCFIGNINLWSLVGPVIIIYLGFKLVLSFFKKDKIIKVNYYSGENTKSNYDKVDSENNPKYFALLSSGEMKNNSNNLLGMRAEAILGGLEIDLRNAEVKQDINIEIIAVLGGVEIHLPENIDAVISKQTPVMAHFSCKENSGSDFKHKVFINYTAVMGSIEIL